MEKRGVPHLTIPIDGQLEELSDKDRSERNAKGHSSSVRSVTGNVPRDEDLKAAAKVINEGKRIAIMAGQGALGAHEELIQLAELLARRSSSRCWARAASRTTRPIRRAVSACWVRRLRRML